MCSAARIRGAAAPVSNYLSKTVKPDHPRNPLKNKAKKRAARLLQRMLNAGISRFEPDPITALERVKSPA